jgi:hypothetical protein
MLRDTDKRSAPRTWSGTSTAILAAFVVIGTLQAGSHHMAGAVICFALAVAYPPLRVLRGRLTSSRNHR